MSASVENLANAATPHYLLHDGLISPTDIPAEAMTDGVLLVSTEADRVGFTEDGATVLRTEHGHVPLQPGTVLNVIGMDDEGVFSRSHYIGDEGELRDVLEHEDGSPYFPPVVTGRMGGIAAVNAAIREEFDAPQPVPMHGLYEREGWTLDHNPDEPTHPSLVNPAPSSVELFEPDEPVPAEPRVTTRAIGRARPVLPRDMEFNETHQAQLNARLNMEDVLNDAASAVEAASAIIADEASQQHTPGPEVRNHRDTGEGIVTHLAAGASALARTVFRRSRSAQSATGRHRTKSAPAQP